MSEHDERSDLERRLTKAAEDAIDLGLIAIPMAIQEAARAIGELRRAMRIAREELEAANFSECRDSAATVAIDAALAGLEGGQGGGTDVPAS